MMKQIARERRKNSRKAYLGMFWLRGIKICTNPGVSGELDTGHEISDQNILFLHYFHVEKMSKRLAVDKSYDVGVHSLGEREGWRNVGTENGALVLLHS